MTKIIQCMPRNLRNSGVMGTRSEKQWAENIPGGEARQEISGVPAASAPGQAITCLTEYRTLYGPGTAWPTARAIPP